jgi:IMP and pyridine-specific 5'-nucleotidase
LSGSWFDIQGLLAVPFVLHSQPTAVFEPDGRSVEKQASVAQQRYAEIFRDVEYMINDHSEYCLATSDCFISTFLDDN